MGVLWYKPRRDPRPRVYWCPGQYGGVVRAGPSLAESVSQRQPNLSLIVPTTISRKDSAIACNIKTKIPKKSIELEGHERHEGIHIYRGTQRRLPPCKCIEKSFYAIQTTVHLIL